MTPIEFANLIKPMHCRTSCSDDNLSNGFGSTTITQTRNKTDEEGVRWATQLTLPSFRCERCAILGILDGGYRPAKPMLEYLQDGHYDAVLAAIRFMKL